MRLLLLGLALVSAIAFADPNTAPLNVGLYRYSLSTVNNTSSSTLAFISRNLNRAGLIIQNNGTVSIVVKPGSPIVSPVDGVVLTAGTIWQPNPPPVDAFFIGSTTSTSASVLAIENIK